LPQPCNPEAATFGGQLKDIIYSMRHSAAGAASLAPAAGWSSDLADISLDAALPKAQKQANPADFPTHWLDEQRRHREQVLLGDGVAELLRDRDYSFILGGAALQYAVPAIADSWQAAQSAIYRLVRACDVLDRDGIALYTPAPSGPTGDDLAQPSFCYHTNVTGQQLPQLLSRHLPPAPLNLAEVLQEAIQHYYRRKREGLQKPNGEIILALFDGEPTHQRALVKTLVQATYHVDQAEELGIGLLQIGNNSIAEGFFSLLEADLKLARARHGIVKFAKVESLDLNSLAEFLTTVIKKSA
jgi:propanediol dehydratase small subunit